MAGMHPTEMQYGNAAGYTSSVYSVSASWQSEQG